MSAASRPPASRPPASDPLSPSRLLAAMGGGRPRPLAEHRRHHPAPPRPGRRPDLRLIDAATESGLRGRGGAGFPTGRKLHAVAGRRGTALVLANGSEGEPASRKDKTLLAQAPHLVLDGMAWAAVAVGANQMIIGVERGTAALEHVRRAVAERTAAEPTIPTLVVEVPAHYVAGEETALVHLVNGGEAKPTLTPPRPFERGVQGRPTVVSNVETYAHLALVLHHGPAWFRALGTAGDPGTALVTVSGCVHRGGVMEIPLGSSLASVIDAAGGPTGDVQAVLLGGYYGTWIGRDAARRARLSGDELKPFGASLGCGAIVVLPADACGLTETANVLTWMVGETAGQCVPCVHGLAALAQGVTELVQGRAGLDTLQSLHRWCGQIEGRGACRFPDGAVRLLRSALTVFEEDVARHLRRTPCLGARLAPRMPIPASVVGWR